MNEHPYRKKWGQNFIQDQNIIKKIITVINPEKNDRIIEIGPGKGALTEHLLNLKKITAIEIDPLLCSYLKEKIDSRLNLINDDILNIKLDNYSNYNKIIGNLPYYITTPIIFKFLDNPFWDEAVFMVQKEVADRIVAIPGNKIYGRLSVMTQVKANIKKEFNISKNIFYPKPKVDSSLIRITIKKSNNLKDFDMFSKIVKESFGKRRKMLKNSLKDIVPISAYIDYINKRPEQLDVNDFIQISNNI